MTWLLQTYVDLSDYKRDFCYEGGFIKTFCFLEEKLISPDNVTTTDYGIMFSIIPPPTNGKRCYINVWHEKRLLSTLYIDFSAFNHHRQQRPDKKSGWRILQDNVGFKYNRFHYRIFNRILQESGTNDIKGICKDKRFGCDKMHMILEYEYSD